MNIRFSNDDEVTKQVSFNEKKKTISSYDVQVGLG